MTRKIFIAIATTLYFAGAGLAQDEVEALRFSRTTHLGTARFAAMGGAFTALGGDASTLALNPAGIGVYRSGEFTLTGNLLYANTGVSYMGNKEEDYRYRFGLSNIAAIGVYELGQSEGLVSVSYGFAYNKTRSFGERYSVLGKEQSGNTYLDYFAAVANDWGIENDDEAWMAWETRLIDTAYKPIDAATTGRQQAEVVGSLSSYDFSFGGNVSNVFYFGMGVGISSVRYEESNTSAESSNNPNFQGFSYNREYKQSGTGYNFKLGVIVWPLANADFLTGLKLGAAIHTRTFLSMSDDFNSRISSRYVGNKQAQASITPNKSYYELETPTRLMAGAAYTFSPSTPGGWRGVLSADYEYVDYSAIKMREDGGDSPGYFSTPNASIKSGYRATNSFRLGGELGHQGWALRLGYAHYDNPYSAGALKDGTIRIYSAGLGLQVSKTFNLSFAYSLSDQKDKGYMYYYGDIKSDVKDYTVRQSNMFMTLGWRF